MISERDMPLPYNRKTSNKEMMEDLGLKPSSFTDKLKFKEMQV